MYYIYREREWETIEGWYFKSMILIVVCLVQYKMRNLTTVRELMWIPILLWKMHILCGIFWNLLIDGLTKWITTEFHSMLYSVTIYWLFNINVNLRVRLWIREIKTTFLLQYPPFTPLQRTKFSTLLCWYTTSFCLHFFFNIFIGV